MSNVECRVYDAQRRGRAKRDAVGSGTESGAIQGGAGSTSWSARSIREWRASNVRKRAGYIMPSTPRGGSQCMKEWTVREMKDGGGRQDNEPGRKGWAGGVIKQ